MHQSSDRGSLPQPCIAQRNRLEDHAPARLTPLRGLLAPVAVPAPAYDPELVRTLILLGLDERRRGRRVVIFVDQAGGSERGLPLAGWLAAAGLRVAALAGDTVAPACRPAWLARQLDLGLEVLLAAPVLALTGLNLRCFGTAVVLAGDVPPVLLRPVLQQLRLGQPPLALYLIA